MSVMAYIHFRTKSAQILQAIALAWILINQPPETHSGTIVLTDVSQDRVIISVDSGEFDNQGRVITDRGCKVLQFGHESIVFVSGRMSDVRSGVVLFDAFQIAKKVFNEFTASHPDVFAISWTNETIRSVGAAIEKYGADVVSGLPDRRFMTAGFAAHNLDGKPVLYVAKIDYEITPENKVKLTTSVKPSPPGITVYSYGAGLAQEFLDGKTARAKELNFTLQEKIRRDSIVDTRPYFITAAVEAAIAWHDSSMPISGPVDTVLVDTGKPIGWIQRKCECYEHDAPYLH